MNKYNLVKKLKKNNKIIKMNNKNQMKVVLKILMTFEA